MLRPPDCGGDAPRAATPFALCLAAADGAAAERRSLAGDRQGLAGPAARRLQPRPRRGRADRALPASGARRARRRARCRAVAYCPSTGAATRVRRPLRRAPAAAARRRRIVPPPLPSGEPPVDAAAPQPADLDPLAALADSQRRRGARAARARGATARRAHRRRPRPAPSWLEAFMRERAPRAAAAAARRPRAARRRRAGSAGGRSRRLARESADAAVAARAETPPAAQARGPAPRRCRSSARVRPSWPRRDRERRPGGLAAAGRARTRDGDGSRCGSRRRRARCAGRSALAELARSVREPRPVARRHASRRGTHQAQSARARRRRRQDLARRRQDLRAVDDGDGGGARRAAQSLPRLRELFTVSGLELGGASVHNGRDGQPPATARGPARAADAAPVRARSPAGDDAPAARRRAARSAASTSSPEPAEAAVRRRRARQCANFPALSVPPRLRNSLFIKR